MADVKMNIEVGYVSNKQEFDKINKQLEELLLKLERKKNAESDSKQKKVLEDQINVINRMAIAYEHAFDSKTGQINISKLTQEMKKADVSVQQFQQNMRKAGQDGAVAYNSWAASILNTNIQLKESSKLLDKMATTFKNTIRYGISSSIFNNFTNSVQKAYDYTKNLDTSLNDIRIVSGKSAEEMEQFAISANKAAQSLGKTTLDYTKAATIYYQQGLSTDEVEKRTEVTLKAANVTGQNAQEVSEQLTAVWNGYQVTGEKLEETIDKLAAVAAHSASNLEELSTGMSKVASAANVMGVDIDQLNAQMSTIISVTRQAPESVGTALRTIYARIADINAGMDEETTLGNYSGKMAKLGFNVLDANGKLKDMGDVIEEIGGKWESLDREQQIALARTMAGTRQYNNLLTLFDNWDKYTDALETSQDAAGTLQKQQDIYMESTEAHLKQLQAETEELYNTLFDQDAVRGFIDLITEAVDVLGNYIKGLGGGLETLIGLGSQFANIFSKQIASGIGNQLANLTKEKENKALLQRQQQVLAAGPVAEDSEEGNKNNEQLFSNKQKIDSVRGILSQEDYKDLIKQEEELYLLQKQRGEEIAQYQQICANVENLEKKHAKDLDEINILIAKGGEKQKNLDEKESARLDELLKKTEEVRKAREQKDSWSGSDATEAQRDAARAEEIQGNIDKSVEFAQKQQAIQDVIKGTTALLMTMTSVKSIFSIITDEDISTWDKFKSIVGILIMQIPTLITSLGSLKKMKQSLLLLTQKNTAAEGADAAAKKINNAADIEGAASKSKSASASTTKIVATKGETVATNEQTAAESAGNVARLIRNMLDHTWLTLGIVAGIGAVVLGLGALINALLSTKSTEERLKEAIEETNEKLKEAKDNYKELKDTMSNYQSAKEGIDKLTQGTVEFYDAIIKANDEAQKLIDKWGLLANQDYTIDKNGLININEDTLKDNLFAEQQMVYKASAQHTQANLELQKYYANGQIEKFQNEINTNGKYQYAISFDQAKTILDDYYKISQETAKNTSDSVKAIGEMSEKVLTGWDFSTIQQETTNDITEAIKTYAPNYGSYSAQVRALNNQLSDELIRAYGSQEQVNEYNNASSRQKAIIQNYVSNNREQFQSTGTLEEYVGRKTVLAQLGNRYDEMSSTLSNYLNKKYGYEYNEKADTWTKNGRAVDKDDIETLIDSLGGYFDAYKEALKEEYVTGNYATSPNLETILSRIEKGRNEALNAGLDETSQKYVAEAYSALITGQKYNTNLLTNQEKSVVNSLINPNNLNLSALTGGVFGGLALPFQQLEMGETEDRSVERKKADMEDYNATLKEQAELLETTSTALEFYGLAMSNAGTLLNEYNEQSAETIANSYKFNKNYNDAVKIYQKNEDAIKDWTQAMEEGREVSYETADAMGEVAKSLMDMGLSLNANTIADHLDLINSLLNGTEEEARAAYEALYELAQLDVLKNMFGDTTPEEQIEKFGHSYQQLVDEINNTSVGDPLAEEYEQSLRKMLEDTSYTVDQIKELSNQLGITIPVEYQVPKNFSVENVDFTTAATSVTHRYTGQMPNPAYDGKTNLEKTIDVDYAWVETTEEKHDSFTIPKETNFQVNKTKQTSAASSNFSRSPSNSKSSKKSGSTAKPSKKDLNKEELDRYQLVNVQLKEISKQLAKLDKEKNKLLGGKLVANLNKQIKLLNDQISVTERKLKIAQGEQNEIANKLSGYGIKFDNEGNISNYAAIFKQEQAKLNAVYTAFNGMSKDAQDAYQDTVKAAEESWKTFKDSISKYDNLIGETIPQLQQDIQDAFDKQTEMYIEEFNAEIKVRLDMSSAERDWNEFKRKVIDGIKDDDILGMATAKLKDFHSYYNETGTAEIQSLTKQLEGQLEELKKQDEAGGADWYRDNRVKAIEDLKDNYDKIRQSLEDIVELEEEMQKKVVESLEDTNDKLEDHIGLYENINKQLEHNVELVKLVSGESSYDKFQEFYDKEAQNRKEQLAFQTQRKEYLEQLLAYFNKLGNTEAAKKVQEELDAVSESWATLIEETINAETTKFQNRIDNIFKKLEDKLTGGMGLDYLEKEWNLMSDNSNLILDNINKMQGLQELSKKYNDAINNTSNIKAQQKLAELRDSELESLKSMDSLSEKDLERAEKKLNIIKAQIALEDAQRNKSQMRLRRDSQGNYRYQFVADEDQITNAQNQLSAAYNDLYNFDKARYNETTKQVLDATKEFFADMRELEWKYRDDQDKLEQEQQLLRESYKEKYGILVEQQARAEVSVQESAYADLNRLYAENADSYELMTDLQKQSLNDWEDASQTAFDVIFGLTTEYTQKFQDMTDEEKRLLLEELVPQFKSGIGEMTDAISGEGGFEEVARNLWIGIKDNAEEYWDILDDIKETAKGTYGTIEEAQQAVIDKNLKAIKTNSNLLDSCDKMIKGVSDQYEMLKDLMKQYEQAANQAKQAAVHAYEYIMKAKEAEAKDYKNNTDNGPTTGNTGAYRDEVQENLVKPQAKTAPDIGTWVALPTGTYFYDASGNPYKFPSLPGRTVQIKSTSGDLWKVYNGALSPSTVYIKKSSIGYDTGGYTGDWSGEGRLAMLHQKELVLNKKDTANMLDAVWLEWELAD